MREFLPERIIIKSSIFMELYPIDKDPIFFSNDLPWNNIRMMFSFRKENYVSFLEKC